MEDMYKKPFDACLRKTCDAISYPGNADIAGIGMLCAYSIEAIMAALYFFTFLFFMMHQRTVTPKRNIHAAPVRSWQTWTWNRKEWNAFANQLADAIYFTVDDFFDTALLFSFAVIVAGIIMINDSKKTYDMLQSMLVTGFTLSVVITIWPLRKDTNRRKVQRHIILALVIGAAFYQIRMVAGTRRSTQYITKRETRCLKEIFVGYEKRSLHFVLLEAFTGVSLGLALLILPFSLVKIPEKVQKKWKVIGWIKKCWRPGLSLYGFVCMWISFGTLWWVRGLVERKIGTSEDERRWGFGQVLALTTWWPVQELSLDILRHGAAKALQGRVPRPWEVSCRDYEYDLLGGRKAEATEKRSEELPLQERNQDDVELEENPTD